MRCPVCRGVLSSGGDINCVACGRAYPVIDGIPVLLPDTMMSEHDEIDHDHDGHGHDGTIQKAGQADHFDRAVAEEFEITRPHGTPRLYQFFIREKLRRALAPIGGSLAGSTALTVCGGSGMDAEFLARAGAHVVSSDISLGAARRTQARSQRYGLDLSPVVADAERLPFADQSFDLVFVHDGLHHLEHPERGLAEIARVARRWVSITEPARAAATAIAVRVGLALEREEAGNVVARMVPTEVVATLRAEGFRPLAAERYAMYYRHKPGVIFGLLSRPRIFPIVRRGWRFANALLARAGNKMVVVAERQVRSESGG